MSFISYFDFGVPKLSNIRIVIKTSRTSQKLKKGHILNCYLIKEKKYVSVSQILSSHPVGLLFSEKLRWISNTKTTKGDINTNNMF